jgi:hypothetical protein
VHVGPHDALQESGQRPPGVGIGRGGLGLGDEPAQPVVAEPAQQVFLAGVPPVERADPDAGLLG